MEIIYIIIAIISASFVFVLKNKNQFLNKIIKDLRKNLDEQINKVLETERNFARKDADYLNLKEKLETQKNDIESLQNMSKLTTLILYDNKITSLAPIEYITSLTELDVSDNLIDNIKHIKRLKNLDKLSIARNPITNYSVFDNLTISKVK